MTAQAIVIVGATGDLAQRMLFPSLYFLDKEGLLSKEFRVIGAARASLSDHDFRARVEQTVRERAEGYFEDTAWRRFSERLGYHTVDADDAASFQNLAAP